MAGRGEVRTQTARDTLHGPRHPVTAQVPCLAKPARVALAPAHVAGAVATALQKVRAFGVKVNCCSLMQQKLSCALHATRTPGSHKTARLPPHSWRLQTHPVYERLECHCPLDVKTPCAL